MIRWRGEPDPRHVKAIDAYWTSAAEHGMNASTFTARVIASTGADVAAALSGAVGAMSGPLHGGAPARVLHMIEEVERIGDAETYVKKALDSGERLMGFGHRVYRAEDPRARVLRRTAQELDAPRYEVGVRAGEGRAGRTARPQARPCPRHERRVLGGDHARLRRGAPAHVHLDVHLRPHRGLGRAHPGAEANGQARPSQCPATSVLRSARSTTSPAPTRSSARPDPLPHDPHRARSPRLRAFRILVALLATFPEWTANLTIRTLGVSTGRAHYAWSCG